MTTSALRFALCALLFILMPRTQIGSDYLAVSHDLLGPTLCNLFSVVEGQ
jgi:hypothetical protein